MRLWLLSIVVLSLVSSSQSQTTFLDGIVNFFNRLNPFRSQQSSRPSSSSSPVFRPRPAVSETGTTPAGTSQPLTTLGDAVTFTVPSGQTFQFGQLNIEPIATPGRGNHNFQGQRYLLTWREGNERFTWDQARDYCSSNGMRIVSLENPLKRAEVLRLVGAEGVSGIWLGGKITPDKLFLDWENGAVESIRAGVHPWSRQGRDGRPQPDGLGAENCLAVLNNFYQDGIKYHDVSCHHKKPTICEHI